jgi:hypothetical protein
MIAFGVSGTVVSGESGPILQKFVFVVSGFSGKGVSIQKTLECNVLGKICGVDCRPFD